MADKKNFDDLTPEDLERIARTIWKAKAAAEAAVTAAAGADAAAGDLLLITVDYIRAADELLEQWI